FVRRVIRRGCVAYYGYQGSSRALGARPAGSLAGQFAIEGRERDGKGLQGAQGEAVVHGEDVLRHAAELHHYVIVCGWEGGGSKKGEQ
uniref:Uncharacterized protein n=1 Tax=Kryptolebias marmoratus TaxID=37003 RepID=A0A3Q3AHS7_KRYMA